MYLIGIIGAKDDIPNDGDSSRGIILCRSEVNLGNGFPKYSTKLINLSKFPKGDLIKKEGNVEFYKVPENIEVLTVWNNDLKWLHPESYSIHKNLRMLSVTTNKGNTIEVSDEHSLITVDENLDFKRNNPETGMVIPRLKDHFRNYVKPDKLLRHMKINKQIIDFDYDYGYKLGKHIGKHNISQNLPHYWYKTHTSFRKGLFYSIINSGNKLVFSTTNQTLAYEIILLSNSLDIISSLSITKKDNDIVYNIKVVDEDDDIILTPTLTSDRVNELFELVKDNIDYEDCLDCFDTNNVNYELARSMFEDYPDFFKDEFWNKYKNMVLDDNIEWEMITKIEEIPEITEAYDITVKPYPTFVLHNGIVVYDTASFIPTYTKEAKEEIDTVIGSKSFYLTPDGDITYSIKSDPLTYVLGHLSR